METINCEVHGPSIPSAMCIHMVEASGLEYVEVSDLNDDGHPWAWCMDCEQFISQIDPDAEVSIAYLFKVLCLQCFDDRKQKHRFVKHIEWEKEDQG